MESRCPYCGAAATEDSIRKRELSEYGYLHEDVRFDCSECGETWVHGVPDGEVDDDRWVCDSCGGDYMPHFVFVNLADESITTRPKCVECSYVPRERVEILGRFSGENIRGFVGHHLVTGNREDAAGDPI